MITVSGAEYACKITYGTRQVVLYMACNFSVRWFMFIACGTNTTCFHLPRLRDMLMAQVYSHSLWF